MSRPARAPRAAHRRLLEEHAAVQDAGAQAAAATGLELLRAAAGSAWPLAPRARARAGRARASLRPSVAGSVFNIFLHMALLCKVMCMVEMIGIAQLQPRAGCALAARRRARAQSARSAARARSSAFVFMFMSCGHVHVHVRSRAHAHVHVHARAHACVRMHARSPRARPRGARRRSARALRCPHACTRAPRAHGILYVAYRHDTPHGMACPPVFINTNNCRRASAARAHVFAG